MLERSGCWRRPDPSRPSTPSVERLNQEIVRRLPVVSRGDRPAQRRRGGIAPGIIEEAAQRGGDGFLVSRVEVPPGLAADFRQGRRVGQCDRAFLEPSPRRRECRSSRRAREKPARWPRRRRRAGHCPGGNPACRSGRAGPAAAAASRKLNSLPRGAGADQHEPELARGDLGESARRPRTSRRRFFRG